VSKTRSRIPACLALCLSLLFHPNPSRAQTVEEYRSKIEAETRSLQLLKKQIEETRKKIDQLEAVAKETAKKISYAERRLNLTRRYITRLRKNISSVQARMDSLEKITDRLDIEISVSNRRFNQRIRQAYMMGRPGILELISEARSLNDVYNRYKYISLLTLADRRLAKKILADKTQLLAARDELSRLKKSYETLMREKNSETRRLKRERRRHRRLLARVNNNRKEHLAELREKEKARKALEKLLAELERKRKEALELAKRRRLKPPIPAHSLAELKGTMDWPVDGRVISRFGIKRHPKFKTAIINRGIDISAPLGSQVRSVGWGEVVIADWFLTFGLMVIIDHGDGYYSIYAHLAEAFVSFGDRVKPGDVIGTVGDTGSLEGPILHFEILKGQDPVDPLNWLKPR